MGLSVNAGAQPPQNVLLQWVGKSAMFLQSKTGVVGSRGWVFLPTCDSQDTCSSTTVGGKLLTVSTF